VTHKLLLADDSVTIQRVVELTFSGEDVQVVSVGDGEQAIARIPLELPDIVLADIGMPKRTGYDVAAFVKGRADLSHIPVLLLAGAFEPVDDVRAQQVKCDGVLVKPFEPQMVVARVRELLGRQSAAAQAPAGAYGIAPPPARHAQGDRDVRSLDDLDPERVRAASTSANTDPMFDESLDRLDDAFGETRAAALDEAVVSDFARDLKALRSSQPATLADSDDFGDWDLPSRAPAAAPPSQAWDEPARMPTVEPLAPPPPVTLPPPVALEPRPAPVAAPAPMPRPAPVPAFARPSTPPPAPARQTAPLADVFSSLLAAEEGRPSFTTPHLSAVAGFAAAPAPAYAPAAAPAAPAALSDDEVERIADRVILKLGANVRGTVIDLAASLVRAEIDRLKALR
jgi:DNA-binding response OmpR family regulator